MALGKERLLLRQGLVFGQIKLQIGELLVEQLAGYVLFVLSLLLGSEVGSEFGEGAYGSVLWQVLSLCGELAAELASGTRSGRLWAMETEVAPLVAVGD